MKKIISFVLVLTLCLAFVGCGKKEESVSVAPLALLESVWSSYEESDMFPIAGGDMNQAVMDAPGAFSLEDAENLDYTLGFPASEAAKIDDAASFQHMMNANTFTCGAYHVTNDADVAAVAESIKTNIAGRQWMCGFPETLLIISVGDTLVSAFGNGDLIQTFKTKLQAAYQDAQILVEEPIV